MTFALSQVSLDRGGRRVLDGIDLELKAGTLIAICGPNGAGKSSLLALCAGDLPVTTGQLQLDGQDPWHCSAADLAARRAVMAQNPALNHPFDVAEVVALGAPDTPFDQRKRALAELGSEGLLQRTYTELSGGERRLVQLARVMLQAERAERAGQRPWLLLDEPVNQLDLGRSHQVMCLLAERAMRGWGVVTVMHDLELASRHAQRLVLLADGRSIADAPPRQALTAETLRRGWQVAAEVEAEVSGPGVRIRVLESTPCDFNLAADDVAPG